MVFFGAHNGGNCLTCEWIAATGEITPGTAVRFEQFLQTRGELGCNLVVMDSPGGVLTEGIKLGQVLRKHGCTTTIGKTVSAQMHMAPSHMNVKPGICYSACAYAFLGGERRWISELHHYGVHQHYREDSLTTPLAKTLNSFDMSQSQFLTGLLVAYVIEMNVNPLLVSIASMRAPGEQIAILDRQALEAMKVVTDVAPEMAEWVLMPIATGLVAQVSQVQDDSGAIQRARLSCKAEQPNIRQFEIIVSAGSLADRVIDEVKNSHSPLLIMANTTIEISNYTIESIGKGESALLIVRLPLSEKLFKEIVNAPKLTWQRDLSRANQRFLQGWLSLKKSSIMSKFAFSHCI